MHEYVKSSVKGFQCINNALGQIALGIQGAMDGIERQYCNT